MGGLNGPAMAAVATAATPQVAVDPRLRRWRAVVWVAAGVFVVVFGLLILQRHRTFGTFNFDLGIFDQGLWLLSRGETPFVTLRGLHLFGDHSSYLMLPVVPLYWVLSDVRAMLILTVVVLAIGAPRGVGCGAGRGFVSPGLGGSRRRVSLASSHSVEHMGQLPPRDADHPPSDRGLRPRSTQPLRGDGCLVGAGAGRQGGRRPGGGPLCPIRLVALASPRAWRWRSLRWVSAPFWSTRWCCFPMFSPTGELIYTGRYAQFGEGLGGALVGMVTNPGKVVAELATIDRLGYLAGMLLPLATCLFAPELLAVGLPITLANLLSIHVYQHELKWHYTSYLIAVVAMAAVVGARRIVTRRPDIPTGPLSLSHSLPRPCRERRRRPVAGRRGDPMGGMGSRPRSGRCCARHHPGRRRRGGRLGASGHTCRTETPSTSSRFPSTPPFLTGRCPGSRCRPQRMSSTSRSSSRSAGSGDVAPILDELRADPDFEVITESPVVLLRRRSEE